MSAYQSLYILCNFSTLEMAPAGCWASVHVFQILDKPLSKNPHLPKNSSLSLTQQESSARLATLSASDLLLRIGHKAQILPA